ncbi:nucleotidyltransferase [candidate division KSB1 bacterium]|nr:nucleotidyltransferase [candidate division KSB1 bacterium]
MLNQDYKEMLSILLENNVEFLLVGAYAMAVHGYPRATGDLDIFVRPSKENSQKVYQALAKFGAPLESVTIEDFEKPGTIFQIGMIPRRIDVINEIDGVTFEDAYHAREFIDIEGLIVPVISKQKLIINKQATGRDKDRLDAERLNDSK